MSTQVVEMSSNEAALLRGLQRVIDKQVQMETGFKKAGDASKKAGDNASTGINSAQQGMAKLLPSINSYVTGWISVAGVIQAATQALREHAEEKKRGLTSAERLQEANQQLASVANPGELAGMLNRADTISKKYGIDRAVSREFLFSARSENFEDYIDDAARFSGVMKLETQKVAAGQIPALFDGKLSARESVALSGAAAEQSRLDPDQFLKALPGGASGGAAAGASPEETMALVSVLASKFKSGETASERIGSLGVKLGLDERFKGRGIVDAVKRMQADGALRSDFAGESKELNEAIDAIGAMLPTIEQRKTLLEQERRKVGTSDDWLERKLLERQRGDKDFQSIQNLNRARIEREIAREEAYAGEEAPRQTAAELTMADLERRGLSAGGRYGAGWGAWGATTLGLGSKETELATMWGAGVGSSAQLDFAGMANAGIGASQYITDEFLAPNAKRFGVNEQVVDEAVDRTNEIFGGRRVGMTEDYLKRIAESSEKTAASNQALAHGNNHANANAQDGRHRE